MALPPESMMDRVDQWQCRFLLPHPKGAVNERARLNLARKTSSKHRWCAA